METTDNSVRELKKKTYRDVVQLFVWVSALGFPLLTLCLVGTVIAPFCVADPPSKLLTAKLAFMSLGLLFAMLQVFLGILLTLIGVTSDYDVDGAVGPAKLKIVSTSPGILLVLVGNVLFGFSLMRPSEVEQIVSEMPSAEAVTKGSAVAGQELTVPPLGRDGQGPE